MVNTHCNTVSNLRGVERVGFRNGDVQKVGASCGGWTEHTRHSAQQPIRPTSSPSMLLQVTSYIWIKEVPMANWWATTQVLIIFTSRTFQPGGLCQLLTRSWKQLTETSGHTQHTDWPDLWVRSILLVNIINSCVVAHQFAIGISQDNYESVQYEWVTTWHCVYRHTWRCKQMKDTRHFWMATRRWWENTLAVLLRLIRKFE